MYLSLRIGAWGVFNKLAGNFSGKLISTVAEYPVECGLADNYFALCEKGIVLKCASRLVLA